MYAGRSRKRRPSHHVTVYHNFHMVLMLSQRYFNRRDYVNKQVIKWRLTVQKKLGCKTPLGHLTAGRLIQRTKGQFTSIHGHLQTFLIHRLVQEPRLIYSTWLTSEKMAETFKTIEVWLLESSSLFNEEDFPAEQSSIFYKQEDGMPNSWTIVEWKRPSLSFFFLNFCGD